MRAQHIFRKAVLPALAACLLGAAGSAWGAAAQWEQVDENPDHSIFFYDKASVTRPAPGIIRVWARVVYTPEGKADTLQVLKDPVYQGLAESRFLYDLDCAGNRSQLRQVVHQDATGKTLKEFNLVGKAGWEETPSASRLDFIAIEECP